MAKKLIILIEDAADMQSHWETIQKDYLHKIVRSFCGSDSASQNTDIQLAYFALTNDRGDEPLSIGWTRNADAFLESLCDCAFNSDGGLEEAAIAAALNKVLWMFDSGQQNVDGERHCILVAVSDPYQLPDQPQVQNAEQSVETQTHSQHSDAEKLAKSFAQCSVSLSVICPKKLPKLKAIYDAAKWNPQAADVPIQTTKNPGYLILISENFREAHAALSHLPPSASIPFHSFHATKGGRGPNVAGDGARLNINPYNPNNSKDPKYLTVDLNPFQIKGFGKASLPGNQAGKKVDESHQAKHKLVTGRSVPLLWKNSYLCNEVPKRNEYDFVESVFLKNDRPAADRNVPSIPSISSETPGKDSSEIFKLPSKSNDAYIGYGGNASTGNNSLIGSAEGAFNRLSLEDNRGTHQRETDSWNWEIPQNNESNLTKDPGKNISSMYDHIDSKQYGFVGTNLQLKDQENPSFSAEPHVDPVIDEVIVREIPWKDLVIGELIGSGSCAEVYRANWDRTEVAVKKFLDQDSSDAALAEFKREVCIMQGLRHPNVVLFMGAVTHPPNLSIITEFLPQRSLDHIIHHPHCQIDEKRRIKMALDVAKGMDYLHTRTPTIVHCDLKSPNLLVDNNWNVKVCDFGSSRLKHDTFFSSKSTSGTPEWMAPEVLRKEPSNEKCDVYSFGVILWELATLKVPWSGMDVVEIVDAVGSLNRRLDIPKEVDPLVARIIFECWETDPNLRPSFAKLTEALKPLQRLVIPSHIDQPSPPVPQEISDGSA